MAKLDEIIRDYKKKTGKNAFWGGSLTKQFKKWQEKNDMFPLAQCEEVNLRSEISELKDKFDKLEKIVIKLVEEK